MKFTGKDCKILEKIISLSQNQLINAMELILKSKYSIINATPKYLYAIGNIPIALVAHLDTVFPQTEHKDLYYDQTKNVMFCPQGAGFDDRAGIMAIIKIISTSELRPHIILLTDEEVGGLGAMEFIKANPKPLAETKYLIELDRRNSNDSVFYNCGNALFENYINSFGFKTASGIYSDIYEIAPAWDIAAVNLSIGYQNEHTYSEILFVDDFFKTVDKVKKMLAVAADAPFFNFQAKPEPIAHITCTKCHKPTMSFNSIPVIDKHGITNMVCADCLTNDISWCACCDLPFEKENPADKICFTCKGAIANALI